MKNSIIVFIVSLFFTQFLFAQKVNPILIKDQVKEAFENEDYETAVKGVNEMETKYNFKEIQPAFLAIRIKALDKIIRNNPFSNYQLIGTTRKHISNYLKNPDNKGDSSYYQITDINNTFELYPKNIDDFNASKIQYEKEVILQKEREVIASAEEKARLERVAIETKARLERESAARKERLEQERISNQKIAVEKEKKRLLKVESDKLEAKKDELFYKKIERERLRKRPFSSIGLQSGEIAKYGLLYERGGKSFIGFHMSARTSLTSEEDILNGSVTENKSEIDLGPNFKISRYIYLNLGAGYGIYSSINRNDYSGTSEIKQTGYIVTSAGLMIRLGKVVNINGGASFMDIDKDIYKPEIIFGLSFNLK